MVKRPTFLGLALLSGGALMIGPGPEVLAATSAALNILSSDQAGEAADTVDIGSLKPLARPIRTGSKPFPVGNPLWSVPLSVLTATQERPIFSASRRPPQRAVVALVDQVNAVVPQKVAEPESPPLALIGAVVGDSDAIAVFFDRTNQKIVRLRPGESHAGWLLSSVLPREVTLEKADRAEVLVLKSPDVAPGVAGVPGFPVLPAQTTIGGTTTDASYAPFVPRSTPKNGESDGL